MKISRPGVACLLWMILGSSVANLVPFRTAEAAMLITFDVDSYGNPLGRRPAVFALTTALRDLYAPLGVHFLGPGTLDGGAILDATQSGFGQQALSGYNFLAFNDDATLSDGGIPRGPETILFDHPQFQVSFMLAGSYYPTAFYFEVFDENDKLLSALWTMVFDWKQISFDAEGIRKLVITRRAGSQAFVLEDLYFDNQIRKSSAVPEPGSAIQFLTAISLCLVGFACRQGRSVIGFVRRT